MMQLLLNAIMRYIHLDNYKEEVEEDDQFKVNLKNYLHNTFKYYLQIKLKIKAQYLQAKHFAKIVMLYSFIISVYHKSCVGWFHLLILMTTFIFD